MSKADIPVGEVFVRNQEERNIILAITKLNTAYAVCYENYSLNNLCLATFNLASAFSAFYNNYKILSEPNQSKKSSMLAICLLVKKSLEKALWVLGIDSVEKM